MTYFNSDPVKQIRKGAEAAEEYRRLGCHSDNNCYIVNMSGIVGAIIGGIAGGAPTIGIGTPAGMTLGYFAGAAIGVLIVRHANKMNHTTM